MIYAIAVVVVVLLWAVRKSRSAHLGNDVLKFQVFQWLRHRNMREARKELTYQSLEKKLWLRISILTVCGYASSISFLKEMGLSLTSSLVISLVPTAISVLMWLRYSRTYRHITLPLFATLCRMPQSHWDMENSPRKWVRVNLQKGLVWIRLPKDWHANKRQLDVVQDLVSTRLPGSWHMTANTRKFLLTFKRESPVETIPVPPPIPAPAISDELDFVTAEKDIDDGPW